MRALVAIGTRPEAIKLAPVIRALQAAGIETECLLSSQHTDLLAPMLDFFGLKATYDLRVMNQAPSLPDVAAKILSGTAEVLRTGRHDVVIVQGDTTTAFAAGLAGFYQRVKVAHVEAGLRSHDLTQPFPEEAHRRFVDLFADWLFVPTAQAEQHLLAERIPPDRIHVSGNTGIDALLLAKDAIRPEHRPIGIDPQQRLLLVTAHRRESFGEPLRRIFRAVAQAVRSRENLVALIPLHPNPQVREAAQLLVGLDRVRLVEPLSYPEFVAAMLRADVILTDSGGVQEEAPVLGKPILVTRERTERPEGIAAGVAELVGTDEALIVSRVLHHLEQPAGSRPPSFLYGDGQASERIAECLGKWASANSAGAIP